jgi:hypothetical protein
MLNLLPPTRELSPAKGPLLKPRGTSTDPRWSPAPDPIPSRSSHPSHSALGPCPYPPLGLSSKSIPLPISLACPPGPVPRTQPGPFPRPVPRARAPPWAGTEATCGPKAATRASSVHSQGRWAGGQGRPGDPNPDARASPGLGGSGHKKSALRRGGSGPALTVRHAPAGRVHAGPSPRTPPLPGSRRPGRQPPHGRPVPAPAPPSSAAPRPSVRRRGFHARALPPAAHVGRTSTGRRAAGRS